MNREHSENEILVCVPTFNSQDAVKGTLKSIFEQTYGNFRVLVVDNHSTDQTARVVQQFKNESDTQGKLTLVENQENLGRIGNWNKCLDIFKKTSHRYLKFVFAGDTLEGQCLERLRGIFDQHPRLGLAASGYFVHVSDSEVKEKVSFEQPRYFTPLEALRAFLRKGNWVGAPVSCMFSREAVLDRSFSEKLGWVADWKFCVDTVSRHDSFYTPELLGRFYASQRKYYSRHKTDVRSSMQDFLMYGFISLEILQKKLRSFLHFLKAAKFGFLRWLMLSGPKRYAFMQKLFYDQLAEASDYSSESMRDRVVGSYGEHDLWKDYDEYLMKYADVSFKNKLALDFGCGPGRNIIRYHARFKRLDGVDISEKNIKNAKGQLARFHVANSELFVNNGRDLKDIPSSSYDFIMSTICLQHICVYRTRYNLLKEFFRVLAQGGRISIQMGYGKNAPNSVPYEADNVNAIVTNRGCDTRVENPEQIQRDLAGVGFQGFEYFLRPTGPGDTHP
ncbi:MAG: glycosyltransferase, partial [Candidatus Wildermuthbacteria bacterium]|nr:glycosyltransferase [Candidatus Wildermuthbacteria bacterium]